MQVITTVIYLAIAVVALFAVKALALAALDLVRAVARERKQVVKALFAGAAVGATLGLFAALRADLNVPVMMLATATSVVLGQVCVAVMVGMHRKQYWAWAALDAMTARYAKAN